MKNKYKKKMYFNGFFVHQIIIIKQEEKHSPVQGFVHTEDVNIRFSLVSLFLLAYQVSWVNKCQGHPNRKPVVALFNT